MSNINNNFHNRKEVTYVQNTNKETLIDDLRALIISTNEKQNMHQVDSFLPLNTNRLDPLFLNALRQSFLINVGLLLKEPSFYDPLWVRILKNNNGLRYPSEEWLKSADNFFSKINLISTFDFHERIQSSSIESSYHAKVFWQHWLPTEIIGKYRKQILSNTYNDAEILTYIEQNINEENINTLLGMLLVASSRKEIIAAERCAVLVSEKIKTNQANDPLVDLQLRNSLNYYLIKSKNNQSAWTSLEYIENQILPKINDENLKSHVMGNLFLHKSELYAAEQNPKMELECLLKSADYDPGFCDVNYRIACIYHDNGHSEARMHYLEAIKNSPMFKPYLNDYGCLLSDVYGSSNETVNTTLNFIEALFNDKN